jgi:hypothetical protein
MKKKNRLPVPCFHCGVGEVIPPKKYCCAECVALAKKEREAQYQADIKSGKRLRHGQGPRRMVVKKEDEFRGEVRSCLRCGRDFLSFGKQNRLCGGCNQSNSDWMAGKTDQFIYSAALWDGYYND